MKRFFAALCGFALLAGLLSLPPAGAATGIYFTAVNDQLLSLSSSTMPLVRNGTVYAPYSIFNPDVAKVSVGVFFSRNNSEKTITLYGMQKLLTFDLSAGNCHDLEKTYSAKAFARNGITYLPVYFVCNYFGLNYSYLSTDLGPLIRIKNSDAVLSDYAFVKAASLLMQQYLREYRNGQTTTVITPPPAAKPSSPTSGNSSSTAVTPRQPGRFPTQEQEEKKGLVYLAFSCGANGAGQKILNALDAEDVSAFFFFRPEDLAANDDLVRRIVGSGYGIGLILTGTETNAGETLSKGNQQLKAIARISTRILLAPGLSKEQKSTLSQEGYLFWGYNISSTYNGSSSRSMAAALEEKIDAFKTTARVLLGDSTLTANALPRILNDLENGGFGIRQITETDG